MTLIGLIVVLLVVGAALYIIQILPVDATIKRIITVLALLFVVLWVLSAFGLLPHGVVRIK